MRAIFINTETQEIKEVDYKGDFHEIYGFIGNDCHTFCGGGYIQKKDCPDITSDTKFDAIYCDDEGLLKPFTGAMALPNRHPLFGNIFITGIDYETGDSIGATTSVEWLKENVAFLGLAEILELYEINK